MADVSDKRQQRMAMLDSYLVARELVDPSAITVVEATMFAVGRGFTVPEEREGLAMEKCEESSWLETCPLITI